MDVFFSRSTLAAQYIAHFAAFSGRAYVCVCLVHVFVPVLSIKNTFICYIVLWSPRSARGALKLRLAASCTNDGLAWHSWSLRSNGGVHVCECVWVLFALKYLHTPYMRLVYCSLLLWRLSLMFALNFKAC